MESRALDHFLHLIQKEILKEVEQVDLPEEAMQSVTEAIARRFIEVRRQLPQ